MKSRAAWTAPGAIILKNINPAIQAESLEGPGYRRSMEAARSERTWGPHRTFAEYTRERVRSTCRILVHVGHRHPMQPQTNQAQQRRSQQGSGFYSYLAPFVSAFEVVFVGGNTTQAREVYLLSVGFSTCTTKEAGGRVLLATLLRIRSDGHFFAHGMPDRPRVVSSACGARRDGAARGLRSSSAFWEGRSWSFKVPGPVI
jgi:hypothetical protein